ncbi:hypothetical protein [Kitasatospora sp. DSM 101779]|uniref:hypothetical protein n=1 Tax=Kitasatospora sp. DSM 101779 TaxID=2853165 RepID=UPI0021D9CC0B|nr:hypothetical protein [Kitasatospora sp. DSM 101779]MCU7826531.1 hypothetical protein [Kitasatospora sp. DSM 101779]
MGRSWIEYGGRGFWAADWQAEVWLHLLAQQAGRVADRPAWLEAARAEWAEAAGTGLVGCVPSGLDEWLAGDPARAAAVLRLVAEVERRVTAWAPAIPCDAANALGAGGPGDVFTGDVPVGPLLDVGAALAGLLRDGQAADPCGEPQAE